MLDTVENRTHLALTLGLTLQWVFAHHTMHESSQGMGIGVPVLLENNGIRGVRQVGVLLVAELGRGGEEGRERWVILYKRPVFLQQVSQ